MSSVVSDLPRPEILQRSERAADERLVSEELDTETSAGRGIAWATLIGGAFWLIFAVALWSWLH